ncbi:MAG: SET domain-containing protein-lysine N-methyltransferase [Kiritimatiellales bacterium]
MQIKTSEGICVVVKKTEKCGRGVFAAEPIFKGTLIHVHSGERMSADRCYDLIRCGLVRNDDPLQISSHEFYVLHDFSNYFNHSCDPNAGFREESSLFSLRDISPGEEIRYDYSTCVPTNLPVEWTMSCACGSGNCRHLIGHVLTLSIDRIALYLESGAFQTYMLSELRRVGKIDR